VNKRALPILLDLRGVLPSKPCQTELSNSYVLDCRRVRTIAFVLYEGAWPASLAGGCLPCS